MKLSTVSLLIAFMLAMEGSALVACVIDFGGKF